MFIGYNPLWFKLFVWTLSAVLCGIAGVMLRNFRRVIQQPLGFEPEGLASVVINPPPDKYPTPERTLDLYQSAAEHARSCGIIIADTKFEWGLPLTGPARPDSVILIDEALTPDSSRFWPLDQYRPGSNPPSFDKQYVRDWLETTTWDKNSPPPELPADVVARTRSKYLEAYEKLTGQKLKW